MSDPDRLAEIKAAWELLTNATDFTMDGATPMQRCRHCGEETTAYPETELLHKDNCPVLSARQAHRGAYDWLVAEVERLRPAEQIVRALADEAPPIDHSELICQFCNASVGTLDPASSHSSSCPWRLADEWVERGDRP
jgi:hypothetical protein